MMDNDLTPEIIASSLETQLIGREILYIESLPSTMDIAREEAVKGACEGTVVIAGRQTAGRGRLKRVWNSPEGNIAMSVILRPQKIVLSSLIMLASLAVMHGIQTATGLKPALKWPNDVLINDKKVCGILIENKFISDRVDYSIIGIGINVNMNPADLPDIQSIATSLSYELGHEISLLSVIQHVLTEMERLYFSLIEGNSLFEEWRGNLITIGKSVHVDSGSTVFKGIAESVERDGSLLIRQQDGTLTRVLSGDVTRDTG